MISKSLHAFLLVPAVLRAAWVQASMVSTACNNSPSLCDRAYNNITHLGAHDSPFVRDAANDQSISGNQYYNTTIQLSAGVRLLTAQVQINSTNGELHVCHTSCVLYDAGKLSDWLAEINGWLDSNLDEVVTVLLVNGASASASSLASEYEAANITHYAYTPPVQSATSSWPTLQSLINNGTRLLNFVASLSDNSAAPYLMDEFTYVFENNYVNTAPTEFSCAAQRPASVANNTAEALGDGMMPLMNHFLYEQQAFGIQSPNSSYAATTNAPSGGVGNLGSSADACAASYGKAPTFVLVDFFNVGPSIETVDRLNGVTDPVGRTTTSSGGVMSESSLAASVVARSWMLCLTLLAAMLVGA